MKNKLKGFEDMPNKATAENILRIWSEIQLEQNRNKLRKQIEDDFFNKIKIELDRQGNALSARFRS